jgi:hypothetical protein
MTLYLSEFQLNGKAPYRSYQGAGKARQQANSTRPCHQTSDPVTTFQLPESSMAIAMATISQVGDFYSDPVQKSQMSHFAASLPLGLINGRYRGELPKSLR